MTLTDKIEEKLVAFFANHSVTEILDKSSELLKQEVGSENHREICGNPKFNSLFEALKLLREYLEKIVNIEKGVPQVQMCLTMLREKRNKSKRDYQLLEKLIREKIYRHDWNENEKKYFDFGVEMIADWKDYFLSYTNRNKHETNNYFSEVISFVFGETFFNDNKERFNCAAHLIVHCLEEDGLVGFFDKHDMEYGDVIEDRVHKHCRSVYALVQLVEKTIFKHDEERRNWCYEEFDTFTRWLDETGLTTYDRHFFILTHTGKEVSPAVLHGDYKDWKDKLFRSKFIEDLSGLNVRKIKIEVNKIAEKIRDTRNQMLEDYCKLVEKSND